jgi:hypothetical protein
MTKYFLGIDPGSVSGAWCLISDEKSYISGGLFEPPMHDLRKLMNEIPGNEIGLSCLELVHAMPGQGVTSVFSFGASFGYWKGFLDSQAMPYITVTPQKWQKTVLDVGASKAPPLKGESEAERERRRAANRKIGKEAIVSFCLRTQPAMQEVLHLKKNQGIADAYCLAVYARLIHG